MELREGETVRKCACVFGGRGIWFTRTACYNESGSFHDIDWDLEGVPRLYCIFVYVFWGGFRLPYESVDKSIIEDIDHVVYKTQGGCWLNLFPQFPGRYKYPTSIRLSALLYYSFAKLCSIFINLAFICVLFYSLKCIVGSEPEIKQFVALCTPSCVGYMTNALTNNKSKSSQFHRNHSPSHKGYI